MIACTLVDYTLLLSNITLVRSYIFLISDSNKGFIAYCNILILAL